MKRAEHGVLGEEAAQRRDEERLGEQEEAEREPAGGLLRELACERRPLPPAPGLVEEGTERHQRQRQAAQDRGPAEAAADGGDHRGVLGDGAAHHTQAEEQQDVVQREVERAPQRRPAQLLRPNRGSADAVGKRGERGSGEGADLVDGAEGEEGGEQRGAQAAPQPNEVPPRKMRLHQLPAKHARALSEPGRRAKGRWAARTSTGRCAPRRSGRSPRRPPRRTRPPPAATPQSTRPSLVWPKPRTSRRPCRRCSTRRGSPRRRAASAARGARRRPCGSAPREARERRAQTPRRPGTRRDGQRLRRPPQPRRRCRAAPCRRRARCSTCARR